MRTLVVVAPGLLTTVQDLGRFGYGAVGVSPSGAADTVAFRAGNRLLGNDENAPALEMTLIGGTFEFPGGAAICLTGSDFGASIDGAPAALWTAHRVPAGGRLTVGLSRAGARCYLCVGGGLEVPRTLGSASVHLLSGLGGRPLRKGDVLGLGPEPPLPRAAPPSFRFEYRRVIRVTPAPQTGWFDTDLCAGTYRVTEQADRLGLRLEGPVLEGAGGRSMLTEGVPLGAVQVSGGKPIILFVEQQTTGGYPKIANVIAADLPAVGQLRPRDEIRFEWTTPEEARRLLLEQEAHLKACTSST